MLALQKLADRLDFKPDELRKTLMATVFAGARKDEEFAALLLVSNTYGLNPLTKEIYAYPAKSGAIVPIVSIDGWLRIINNHPQMDGMVVEMAEDGSACTVTIHRKDRRYPTIITEYLAECKRNTDPWNQCPKRMLRHKAIIQAGRVAFGFGGIYDEDEGKAIAEAKSEKPAKGRLVPDQLAIADEESIKADLRKELKALAKADGVHVTDLVRIAKANNLATEMDGEREVLTFAALESMVENWHTLDAPPAETVAEADDLM